MTLNDAIKSQQELLATHRSTLDHLVKQAAAYGGEAFSPPQTAAGIANARSGIARIKDWLYSQGIIIDDEPNDFAPTTSSHDTSAFDGSLFIANVTTGENSGTVTGVVINNLAPSTDPKQSATQTNPGAYSRPLIKRETLYSNLLKVSSFAPLVYVAETSYRDPKEIWEQFKLMSAKVSSEWLLINKQIISFHNLDQHPFKSICDLGTVESFHTREWSDSNDKDKKREFVRLLNKSLRERTRILGLWSYREGKRQYYYFPASKNLSTRRVGYQSIKRRSSREVFKAYNKKKDPTERAYCRHSAFKSAFLRQNGQWYLEITPTYHFTVDGYKEDRFRAERLKGIKQLERNPAVIGQLLMWADLLARPTRDLFSDEYSFLSFGRLATVEISASIPDDVWYKTEEGDDAQVMGESDNQLPLAGL